MKSVSKKRLQFGCFLAVFFAALLIALLAAARSFLAFFAFLAAIGETYAGYQQGGSGEQQYFFHIRYFVFVMNQRKNRRFIACNQPETVNFYNRAMTVTPP